MEYRLNVIMFMMYNKVIWKCHTVFVSFIQQHPHNYAYAYVYTCMCRNTKRKHYMHAEMTKCFLKRKIMKRS